MQFHTHLGYKLVGEFHKCGYKFGRWYNMVWMEKIIGVHSQMPSPLIRFPDLNPEILRELGIYGSADESASSVYKMVPPPSTYSPS